MDYVSFIDKYSKDNDISIYSLKNIIIKRLKELPVCGYKTKFATLIGSLLMKHVITATRDEEKDICSLMLNFMRLVIAKEYNISPGYVSNLATNFEHTCLVILLSLIGKVDYGEITTRNMYSYFITVITAERKLKMMKSIRCKHISTSDHRAMLESDKDLINPLTYNDIRLSSDPDNFLSMFCYVPPYEINDYKPMLWFNFNPLTETTIKYTQKFDKLYKEYFMVKPSKILDITPYSVFLDLSEIELYPKFEVEKGPIYKLYNNYVFESKFDIIKYMNNLYKKSNMETKSYLYSKIKNLNIACQYLGKAGSLLGCNYIIEPIGTNLDFFNYTKLGTSKVNFTEKRYIVEHNILSGRVITAEYKEGSTRFITNLHKCNK